MEMVAAGIAPRTTVDIISSQLISADGDNGVTEISALSLLFKRVRLFGSSGFALLIVSMSACKSKRGTNIRVMPRVTASARLSKDLHIIYPSLISFIFILPNYSTFLNGPLTSA